MIIGVLIGTKERLSALAFPAKSNAVDWILQEGRRKDRTVVGVLNPFFQTSLNCTAGSLRISIVSLRDVLGVV